MINGIQNLKVEEILESGVRLDKYLSSKYPDYSRTYIQNLIKDSRVKLNGSKVSQKTSVEIGDAIIIDWPEEKKFDIPSAEEFNFKILFEDDDMLIIDKPAGIVVHPAAGNWTGTVVNALLGKDENFLDNLTEDTSDELSLNRPGIVHRLDKETSGCLIVAKNPISKAKLCESFASRNVKKTYKAIVIGTPKKRSEKIETLISRHRINRQKMMVVNHNGKEAVTIYDCVKTFEYKGETLSLLDVQILTGRTHQIRVHLAYRKLPVLGDKIYGGKQNIEVPRQMLHAWKIEIPHPTKGIIVSVESPLPEDFNQYIV